MSGTSDSANADVITRFYAAFARGDADAMGAAYADDATFEDPAFGTLTASEARAMWKMLTGRSSDLRVECRDVTADDRSGSAHWEAWYTFGGKHPVHNVIQATFEFRDGLIAKHVDSFDFPRWAGQALGLPGKLLGRTSILHNKTTARAKAQLAAYMSGASERSV